MPGLERPGIVFEFLATMEQAPLLPRALRPFPRLLIGAAVDLVPADLRVRWGSST